MQSENTSEPITPKKKNKAIFILPIIIGVGLFFGIKSYIHAVNFESTDNAQIETNTLPLVSRVSGYVDSIGVSDFGDIKVGQLLLKIDDSEYKLAIKQAEADLSSALADLSSAQSNLVSNNANSNVVKANSYVQKSRLDKAKIDLQRDEALYKEGAITKKQIEDSRANYEKTLKWYEEILRQMISLRQKQGAGLSFRF